LFGLYSIAVVIVIVLYKYNNEPHGRKELIRSYTIYIDTILIWIKVNKYVSNRQVKMVEAYKKGNFSQLHNIQYQSMMSFEFRAYAIRKVTTNDGRNTFGVDKILWNSPKLKFEAISILRTVILNPRKYNPGPVKRIWIPKPDSDKLRPLGYTYNDGQSIANLNIASFRPRLWRTKW
jgi:RNA-directed DNA polymerase